LKGRKKAVLIREKREKVERDKKKVVRSQRRRKTPTMHEGVEENLEATKVWVRREERS